MNPMDLAVEQAIEPIIDCNQISVSFGDVIALDDVGVAFEPGRIHAVVGQNGAGKTTFARVIAGLINPDQGNVHFNGAELEAGDVGRARDAGIELVHQSFALPPSFTVAEAMQFGAPGGTLYTRKNLEQNWQKHLDDLEVIVKTSQRIRDLPVETQQGVEIARALVTDARLLILDEPTAVLSPESTEKLFERVRRLKQRGVTVILILHKIREVLAIADTVTVLRGGKLVQQPVDCDSIDAQTLSNLIIGSEAGNEPNGVERATVVTERKPENQNDSPILELTNISTIADTDGPALDQINLKVNPGEIVGIAGVEGNGQRTLVRMLADLAGTSDGSITITGVDMVDKGQIERRKHGLRIIPFERNVEGLSLTSSLWANWSVRELLQNPLFSFVKPSALRQDCGTKLDEWNVRYDKVDQMAGSLSGGNAQKVILSRELDQDARLIVAAQPTRGLDIGATDFVWNALREARDRGCGIVFISSDLDEIFDLCDRVVVFLSGRIAGEFKPPYELGKIGAAMTGAHA